MGRGVIPDIDRQETALNLKGESPDRNYQLAPSNLA